MALRGHAGGPVLLPARGDRYPSRADFPGGAPVYAWHNQLSALAAAGHSVYVVDLPGQGRTVLHDAAFSWDLPAMTGALARFLTAVHLQRTALVGNSWSGGMLDAPLATLDGRLAISPGPRCQFLLPPATA